MDKRVGKKKGKRKKEKIWRKSVRWRYMFAVLEKGAVFVRVGATARVDWSAAIPLIIPSAIRVTLSPSGAETMALGSIMRVRASCVLTRVRRRVKLRRLRKSGRGGKEKRRKKEKEERERERKRRGRQWLTIDVESQIRIWNLEWLSRRYVRVRNGSRSHCVIL